MSELVVIKFGGGLITEKGKLCTAKPNVIDGLVDAVSSLIDLGHRVIVIHGAGSFGHLKAKTWCLAQGRTYVSSVLKGGFGLSSQDEAVDSVRNDMDDLNSLVISSFTSKGMETRIEKPRDFAVGTGPNFQGELSRFVSEFDEVVVSFGDVVPVDGEQEFGILSGDDIVYRVAVELDADHVVFAMGGAPGLMTSPPSNQDSTLVTEWRQGDPIDGHHDQEKDVTGGIELKLKRASIISNSVPNVWLIDGEHPERILAAVQGKSPIGTRILQNTP